MFCESPADSPEQFRYTNQGGDVEIPGNDDKADLERTRNAFTVLGVVLLYTHAHAHTHTFILSIILSIILSHSLTLSLTLLHTKIQKKTKCRF